MKEMSDKMKERIAKWLESLEEEERNKGRTAGFLLFISYKHAG